MTVRVVSFARIREIVGGAERGLELDDAATVGDAWSRLASQHPDLGALAPSTRFARNGAFVDAAATLADGDELALLPPFGGG